MWIHNGYISKSKVKHSIYIYIYTCMYVYTYEEQAPHSAYRSAEINIRSCVELGENEVGQLEGNLLQCSTGKHEEQCAREMVAKYLPAGPSQPWGRRNKKGSVRIECITCASCTHALVA